MWLLIHAGVKVNPCWYNGYWWDRFMLLPLLTHALNAMVVWLTSVLGARALNYDDYLLCMCMTMHKCVWPTVQVRYILAVQKHKCHYLQLPYRFAIVVWFLSIYTGKKLNGYSVFCSLPNIEISYHPLPCPWVQGLLMGLTGVRRVRKSVSDNFRDLCKTYLVHASIPRLMSR